MTTIVSPGQAEETKGFIGERFDSGAGLQYLNARYYDPQLGIFIQPDWWEVNNPGVGTNRYAYSHNDPVNLADPGGNCSVCIIGLVYVFEVISDISDDGVVNGTGPVGDALNEVVNAVEDNTNSTVFDDDDDGFAPAQDEPGALDTIEVFGPVVGTIIVIADAVHEVVNSIWDDGEDSGNAESTNNAGDEGSESDEGLPSRDSTGKVHGKLPTPQELEYYDSEELEQFKDELIGSIEERIRKTIELGSDRGHGQRQGVEQDLVRSIEKVLDGRGQ